MYRDKLPENIDRWRIQASLTTCSPFHPGDGDDQAISGRDCNKTTFDFKKADPRYATVFTGTGGKPLIPATSIKGALRAWAAAHGIPEALVWGAFGKPEEENSGRQGEQRSPGSRGALWFSDATWRSCPSPADGNYRCWSPSRQTALSPQVAIDPVTRSAEENLLYYVEYVPEGAVFSFDIVAQGDSGPLRNLALHLLMHAFRSLSRPARLGGQTANGWGKMTCEISACETLSAKHWLAGDPVPWHRAFTPVDEPTRTAWLNAADETFAGATPADTVEIALTLHFDGAMLVNDPTRRREAGSSGDDPVGHAMIRKENGRVFLPGTSVRGAFRAQARRIWQTLAWKNDSQRLSSGPAPAFRSKDDFSKHPRFFQIFGSGGWQSPLEIGDFFLCGAERAHDQEFVAVDRFTGGAAEGKKFRAEGLWKPAFEGRIRIRPSRWRDAQPYAWMLLAFTLRDWAEGDGVIGFGASKGYGGFRASIAIAGEGRSAGLLNDILAGDESALSSPELEGWWSALRNQTEEVAS